MQRDREQPNEVRVTTPEEITGDVLRRYQAVGRGYWIAVAATATLFLVGVLGLAFRLAGGTQDQAAWGYYAATFAYLLTTVQSAPLSFWPDPPSPVL